MKLKFTPKRTALDIAIDEALAELQSMDLGTDEYTAAVDQITQLNALKDEKNPSKRLSPDTLALIAGNLIGILAILYYEQAHVVTSKALSFVVKPK